MVVHQGRYTASVAGGSAISSSVQFGADVSRAPVFLSVDVIPSASFARLMLALGRVVRLQDTGVERDHSAYQEWVHGQYLLELPDQMAASMVKVPALLARRAQLERQIEEDRRTVQRYWHHKVDSLHGERRRFWDWLYTHNREAWIVLDPIVSVQPDATFFEAFSLDESTYARVTLPHVATRADHEPVCGTTNIDFSLTLERELARTRTYRPLHLQVGADSVSVDTGVSSTVEKKIDLPETWVRGLVEVQAALALSAITIEIDSSVLADVLARLEAERERQGPRALVVDLVPGQPVRLIVEPWNDEFIASLEPYTGNEARRIKVWGRRRLRILQQLLPLVATVSVQLLDSGMPSFWGVDLDGINLTIGLSGWTSQDWAGRARFSAFVPASAASAEQLEAAAKELERAGALRGDDLVSALNVEPGQARLLLQRLCLSGSAMYDPQTATYRWRALFPEFDFTADTGAGLEERRGVELFAVGAVSITADDLHGHERSVEAQVRSDKHTNSVVLRRDLDGRVTYAQCDCSHFRYHKLRQGPCRHIVATSLAGG